MPSLTLGELLQSDEFDDLATHAGVLRGFICSQGKVRLR